MISISLHISISIYILEVDSYGLDVECERKRDVKDNFNCFITLVTRKTNCL